MVPPRSPPLSPGLVGHTMELLRRVQSGISPVELVYTTHEHWPLRPGHTRPTLHISILDASFNPPTRAHLALASSNPSLSPRRPPTPPEPYDARMLLLSVRNADKILKPGDATLVQRLEMMFLLSHDMCSARAEESNHESSSMNNVAVAIIDEPTFVGKSSVLLRFLRMRLATVVGSSRQPVYNKSNTSHRPPTPKLTFLMGLDTLTRLFSSNYYPSEQVMVQMLRKFLSPEEEDCRVLCAYRGLTSDDRRSPQAAHEFITGDRITFIDIGTEEQTYSSSEVRAKVTTEDGRWRQLVTDAIANYIIEQGIYSSPGKEE